MIHTQELTKAVRRLEEALNQPKTDFLRDSVIQRFEFCVELAWKAAKKAMGSASASPKDIVREMAQSGYIQDVDVWLKAIDMRNLSAHTYKEDLAEQVYAFAKEFLPKLQELLGVLARK
ncbi:MAG: nucleotidyltransferase substrate binding protein [Bdellovibrionales bacterium]|nr:nucleotidyltransferase substrate binding protein [Bdellovibrionales bacterium]